MFNISGIDNHSRYNIINENLDEESDAINHHPNTNGENNEEDDDDTEEDLMLLNHHQNLAVNAVESGEDDEEEVDLMSIPQNANANSSINNESSPSNEEKNVKLNTSDSTDSNEMEEEGKSEEMVAAYDRINSQEDKEDSYGDIVDSSIERNSENDDNELTPINQNINKGEDDEYDGKKHYRTTEVNENNEGDLVTSPSKGENDDGYSGSGDPEGILTKDQENGEARKYSQKEFGTSLKTSDDENKNSKDAKTNLELKSIKIVLGRSKNKLLTKPRHDLPVDQGLVPGNNQTNKRQEKKEKLSLTIKLAMKKSDTDNNKMAIERTTEGSGGMPVTSTVTEVQREEDDESSASDDKDESSDVPSSGDEENGSSKEADHLINNQIVDNKNDTLPYKNGVSILTIQIEQKGHSHNSFDSPLNSFDTGEDIDGTAASSVNIDGKYQTRRGIPAALHTSDESALLDTDKRNSTLGNSDTTTDLFIISSGDQVDSSSGISGVSEISSGDDDITESFILNPVHHTLLLSDHKHLERKQDNRETQNTKSDKEFKRSKINTNRKENIHQSIYQEKKPDTVKRQIITTKKFNEKKTKIPRNKPVRVKGPSLYDNIHIDDNNLYKRDIQIQGQDRSVWNQDQVDDLYMQTADSNFHAAPEFGDEHDEWSTDEITRLVGMVDAGIQAERGEKKSLTSSLPNSDGVGISQEPAGKPVNLRQLQRLTQNINKDVDDSEKESTEDAVLDQVSFTGTGIPHNVQIPVIKSPGLISRQLTNLQPFTEVENHIAKYDGHNVKNFDGKSRIESMLTNRIHNELNHNRMAGKVNAEIVPSNVIRSFLRKHWKSIEEQHLHHG